MTEGMRDSAGASDWNGLLEQTRRALATLRVEDLVELAARADCMLSATVGDDWIRQRIPRPQAQQLVNLTRQHQLLGDLLLATNSNLAVLRRLRGESTTTRRVESRWER